MKGIGPRLDASGEGYGSNPKAGELENDDWRTSLVIGAAVQEIVLVTLLQPDQTHLGPLQPRFAQNRNFGWNELGLSTI
jgi:hypothetical protein